MVCAEASLSVKMAEVKELDFRGVSLLWFLAYFPDTTASSFMLNSVDLVVIITSHGELTLENYQKM